MFMPEGGAGDRLVQGESNGGGGEDETHQGTGGSGRDMEYCVGLSSPLV